MDQKIALDMHEQTEPIQGGHDVVVIQLEVAADDDTVIQPRQRRQLVVASNDQVAVDSLGGGK